MAYPLIILGAGASFDSIDLNSHEINRKLYLARYMPPLTNSLFDHSREIFQNLLRKYPKVNTLASRVLPVLSDGEKTFEEILQELLDHHKSGEPNRQEKILKELVSLNYYLSDLFYEISNNFFETDNNYSRLINEMNSRLIKSYVVNFNYDLIFEKSAEKDVSKLDSYNDGDVKILKIHGSCNWLYEPEIIQTGSYTNAETYFTENADKYFDKSWVDKKVVTDRPHDFIRNAQGQFGEQVREAFMPAIALPFNRKKQFVCPRIHFEDFEQNIGAFDRVIIIGWRGTDSFLTEKLVQNIDENTKLPTYIITYNSNLDNMGDENVRSAKEKIRKQYSGVPQLEIKDENIYMRGFSNFMRNHKNYSSIFD